VKVSRFIEVGFKINLVGFTIVGTVDHENVKHNRKRNVELAGKSSAQPGKTLRFFRGCIGGYSTPSRATGD
jgi:hypothetical protein